MMPYEATRRAMVENQLRPNRIDDPRVLAAMGGVPREQFVPKALRGAAYADEDIMLGDGRFLIEPLALARMVQTAEVRRDDVAIVIGCTTGYAACVLSRLVATVFLLLPRAAAGEPIDALVSSLGCDNVVVQPGAFVEGLPSQAPFDVILVTGEVPAPPGALFEQLNERGRLVTCVRHGAAGRLTLARKLGGVVGMTEIADTNVPPIPEFQPAPAFVF